MVRRIPTQEIKLSGLMFLKKKTTWENVEGKFDPYKIGFHYNPNISIVGMIHQLLTAFDRSSPQPGRLNNFVGGIMIDGIGYWQLVEECRIKNLKLEFESITERGEVWGFPIFLAGIEGVALCLEPSMAPAVLRQQIEWNEQQIVDANAFADRFGEMVRDGKIQAVQLVPADPTEVEPESPKKEDMH